MSTLAPRAPWLLRAPVILGGAGMLALLLVGGTAVADDPPKPPAPAITPPSAEKPPEFTGGPESFLAPIEAGKPIDWVTTLKTQLIRLRTAPPKGPEDAQLFSAWQSILEPRLGNMIARLEKWEDPARWVVVDGDPKLTVLAQDQWPGFVGSMAFLATELHGAWKQYQNVSIKKKAVVPDAPHDYSGYPGPTVVRLAYPVGGLYQSILQRQAAARQLGFFRIGSHWQLLGRFRYAWDWSWDQSSAWWKYLEKKEAYAARERVEANLDVALQSTRDTLNNTLLGVQAFVAAVQESEQERLRGICFACRTDDATLREMAETALRDMENVQMEAERFQGTSYSNYGSLLRSWYRRQHAAVGVLEITSKKMADEETAEGTPKVGMLPPKENAPEPAPLAR